MSSTHMLKTIYSVLVTAIAYFLSGQMGLLLAIPPGYASAVFPAAAVGFIAVLFRGTPILSGIWLGSFGINITVMAQNAALNEINWFVPAIIAAGSSFQAWLASFLVNYKLKTKWKVLDQDFDILFFLLLAGPLACLISASVGTSTLVAFDIISVSALSFTWWNWWVGDTIGVLLFSPIFLSIFLRKNLLWMSRLRTIAIPTLLISVAIVVVFVKASNKETRLIKLQIAQYGELLLNRINLQISVYAETVASLARLSTVMPSLSKKEFEVFTQSVFTNHSDLHALSWNPLVTSAQRRDFESRFGQENGIADFHITEFNDQHELVAAGWRDWFVAIGYIAPIEANQKALGYDIASDPVRFQAIYSAMKSRNFTVSPPIHLMQDASGNVGLLLLYPVYNEHSPLDAPTSPLGFAVGVFKIEEMLQQKIHEFLPSYLRFSLEDTQAPTQSHFLYQSSDQNNADDSTFIWENKFQVGGRIWKMRLYPTDNYFLVQHSQFAWAVLAGGLLAASLLQAMLLGITGRTSVIQRRIEEQTEEISGQNQSLQRSEQRYRELFDCSPLPMWVFEEQSLVFLAVNPAAISHYGYSQEEFLSMSLRDIRPPEDVPEMERVVAQMGHKPRQGESRHLKKDGSIIQVVFTVRHIVYEQKQACIEVVQDETERYLVCQQLYESEAKLRSFFNLAPLGFTINDLDSGDFLDFNTVLHQTAGYSREEFAQLNFWDITPHEFREQDQQQLELLRETKQYGPYEKEYIRKDGSRYPIVLNGVLLPDSHGRQQIWSIVEDISYRKQWEASLLASERYLRQEKEKYEILLHSSGDGIHILDSQGNVLEVNQKFCDMLGYSRDELLGINVTAWEANFSPEVVALKIQENFKVDNIFETRHKRKNGEIIDVEVSAKAVMINGQLLLWNASRDISERKRLQNELVEARNIAEHAAQLKARFLANMSHEIRTPMNGIIGLTQLALNQEMNAELRSFLEKIYSSSQTLMDILNDILDISKIEAGKMTIAHEPFNLDHLLGALRNLFEGRAKEKKLAFKIQISPETPRYVLGDALRVQQVLSNLLGNALKFTEHGQVTLNVICQHVHKNQVSINFRVTDTGIGISSDLQERLFQPFKQIDNSISRRFGGTGLGLAISHDLLALMGGEISVESSLGQGSTFSFTLLFDIECTAENSHVPDVIETKAGDLTTLLTDKRGDLAGQKILVAEDSVVNQFVISKLLTLIGIDFKVANNGQEALTLLETEDFNAVLMDVNMPVMDGIEATYHIRQQPKWRGLPVIALSAGITDDERENCLANGMCDFLAKPIETEIFTTVLKRWLKSDA